MTIHFATLLLCWVQGKQSAPVFPTCYFRDKSDNFYAGNMSYLIHSSLPLVDTELCTLNFFSLWTNLLWREFPRSMSMCISNACQQDAINLWPNWYFIKQDVSHLTSLEWNNIHWIWKLEGWGKRLHLGKLLLHSKSYLEHQVQTLPKVHSRTSAK